MGLKLIHLVLFSVGVCIVSICATVSKWSNEIGTMNKCGQSTSGYRHYINEVYNVSVVRVADILLGNKLLTIRYKVVLDETKFARLASSHHSESFSYWIKRTNNSMNRLVVYTQGLHNVPFMDKVTINENQTSVYYEDMLVVSINSTNSEKLVNGVLSYIEICAVSVNNGRTSLEVSTKVELNREFARSLGKHIQEKSHNGFIENSGMLDYMLKWLSEHPDEPSILTIKPIPKDQRPQQPSSTLTTDATILQPILSNNKTKEGRTGIIEAKKEEYAHMYLLSMLIMVLSFFSLLAGIIFHHYVQKWENEVRSEEEGIAMRAMRPTYRDRLEDGEDEAALVYE